MNILSLQLGEETAFAMGFPALFPALPIFREGDEVYSLSFCKAWKHVPGLTCLLELHLTPELKGYYRDFFKQYTSNLRTN